MPYLLDSDVIIDFQKSKEPGTLLFSEAIKQKCFISVITYAEIVYGLKNYNQETILAKFQELLENLEIKILGIDTAEALEFVDLKIDLKRATNIIPDFDLLIAATAISYNLSLVTRNSRHSSRIPHLKLFSQKLQKA